MTAPEEFEFSKWLRSCRSIEPFAMATTDGWSGQSMSDPAASML